MYRLLILVFFLFFSHSAFAANLDLKDFGRMAIQSEGRIKPIDTFAKHLLVRFSGKSKVGSESYLEWFASLVFDPESSANKKIFLINNPEVLEALKVEPDKHRRYSFKDLEPGIDKLFELSNSSFEIAEKERSNIEKEFIRVFTNLNSYIQLSNSFLFNFMHPDFTVSDETKEVLGLKSNHNSLFTVITKAEKISKILEEKNLNKDSNREIIRLALLMYDWVERYKDYQEMYLTKEAFDVIPVEKTVLVSPWDQLIKPGIELSPEIFKLSEIQDRYLAKDYPSFRLLLEEYNSMVSEKTGISFKLDLELLYNKVNPFLNTKLFYGLAFLSLLMSIIFSNTLLRSLTWLFTGFAFFLHSFGLISRMLILERAPVSNLFETFIFVSWIIVLVGILLALFDMKSSLGLLLASFSGLVLLLISGKFAVEGDTMQVLIAVLNSNFWLSTHVICITIGYAGVFAAGIVAHIFLIQKLFLKNPELKKLIAITLGLLSFGLCFSFLGTLLGGIWADQSWGRFWGWDPKENGALLIVLWSTLVFHARMAGMVKETGLALLTAFSSVVVITSWFGINLLGVGLHSYGFTSGIATGLYSYYFLELAFFGAFFLLEKRK